jgi:hypothetical protein
MSKALIWITFFVALAGITTFLVLANIGKKGGKTCNEQCPCGTTCGVEGNCEEDLTVDPETCEPRN